MVRPVLGIVVEALDSVDLVLRFHVSVFGHPDVDADPRLVHVRPIEACIGNGFVGAIDAKASRPGAPTNLLAPLVPQLVEAADPGQRPSEVADLVLGDPASTRQQTLAERAQIVAVRRGETRAGDDNPLVPLLGSHPTPR